MWSFQPSAIERLARLQKMKEEANAANNESCLLKFRVNKASAELQNIVETCSLLTEEKRQLTVDLWEEQCKTLTLESKLWGLELQRLWDQTEGIVSFQKTAQFKELLRKKIKAHMQSGDMLYSIAKHWDYSFEAFRKQM
ncbi:hypothetical protein U1Q18_003684 [Sarracenia purpurea var. burkii]